MRVLRTFPPDLVRFVMESCKKSMDEYASKQSRIVIEEEKPQEDKYHGEQIIRELEDALKADGIAVQKDVPILGENRRGWSCAEQKDIIIPGEETLQDRNSDFFLRIPHPMDVEEIKKIINETTAFSMECSIEQLTSFLEEIKKGTYLFSRGAIYDRNDLIAASAPKRINEKWHHGVERFLIESVMHTDDSLDTTFANDVYIFLGKETDNFNTGEFATSSIFLKKRTRAKKEIGCNGDGIIVYDDNQNVFREASFDGEDYSAKEKGTVIDPNDLTIVKEPFFIYRIGNPSDLVPLVEKEKKPDTFLSVGKITRGAYCPSEGQHRWILPLARFQLADFERIHEELGAYTRELVSPRG